jgi:hypothetical protein
MCAVAPPCVLELRCGDWQSHNNYQTFGFPSSGCQCYGCVVCTGVQLATWTAVTAFFPPTSPHCRTSRSTVLLHNCPVCVCQIQRGRSEACIDCALHSACSIVCCFCGLLCDCSIIYRVLWTVRFCSFSNGWFWATYWTVNVASTAVVSDMISCTVLGDIVTLCDYLSYIYLYYPTNTDV